MQGEGGGGCIETCYKAQEREASESKTDNTIREITSLSLSSLSSPPPSLSLSFRSSLFLSPRSSLSLSSRSSLFLRVEIFTTT